ncbi:hypothetical protein GGR52DRAFT_556283, partial [Hypoxylon sp. FL1284]
MRVIKLLGNLPHIHPLRQVGLLGVFFTLHVGRTCQAWQVHLRVETFEQAPENPPVTFAFRDDDPLQHQSNISIILPIEVGIEI